MHLCLRNTFTNTFPFHNITDHNTRSSYHLRLTLPILQLKRGLESSNTEIHSPAASHLKFSEVGTKLVPTTCYFPRGWESLLIFLDWTSQILEINSPIIFYIFVEPALTMVKSFSFSFLADLLTTSVFPQLNKNLSYF